MSKSAGQVVVNILEEEGVNHAFCVPGESYLGIMDGLYEHPAINLVATRHESGASFMAEAYAKASGFVGVCMATRGPGATNLSIGIHTAMQDSTPLVALIGQVERPFLGKEAFQEVDIQSYFSHLCKETVEIKEANRIPELLRRAFNVARSGRPGPVVVSLPHDMLEEKLDTFSKKEPNKLYPPGADVKAVEAVVKEISQSSHPIVIAGGGVIASDAKNLFALFVEKMQLPVVSSFRRFNILSNDHENYAGWLGFGADEKLLNRIRQADTIIALGTRLSQVTTQNYTLLGDETRLIQIDISEDAIGKSYPVSIGIVSDVKLFLEKAVSFISDKDVSRDEQRVHQMHEDYLVHSTPPSAKTDSPFVQMNGLVKDLMLAIPNNSIITSDAGNFYGWLARYYRFTDTKRYIGPTSGAMGYGLPSAIGAKVACPKCTVISLSGDGGFLMTAHELETAAREKIKVIAIVVNNNMYGTIRAHQERHFPGRQVATRLTNPNFAELAQLYGCEGEVVTNNQAFMPAFKNALQSKRPYVIEVRTDPEILSVMQAVEPSDSDT